jgi:hypothetical protein
MSDRVIAASVARYEANKDDRGLARLANVTRTWRKTFGRIRQSTAPIRKPASADPHPPALAHDRLAVHWVPARSAGIAEPARRPC